MNKKIFILIFIYFIQGIVTNIHHPLMPSYTEFLQLPDYMFGFLFAFMNIGIMIGSPYFGNLGDSGKKKISLIVGLSIYAIAQLVFGYGHLFNGWILSIIRLISGFGIAASFTIIASELMVQTNESNRSKVIGYGAAALVIGGSIGQYLGGFINNNEFIISLFKTDQFVNAFTFQFVSIMLLVILVSIVFKPAKKELETKNKRTSVFEGFKEIKNVSFKLLMFLIALVIISIAATNVDKYIDFYFNKEGLGSNYIGEFKMVVGFVSVFASLLVVPFLVKFKNKNLLMIIMQLVSSILMIIIFVIEPFTFLTSMYSIYMLYIILKTSFTPLEQAHIASHANDNNLSKTMGLRQAFLAIGPIIGPIFGGFLFNYSYKLLFITSGILFLIAIIFLILSREKVQTE